MIYKCGVLATFAILASFNLNLSSAAAEFIIDETQSEISLSGKAAGSDLREQGPGSLTTRFEGKLQAEVSGTGIQFTGGSTVTAQTNGVWRPGVKGAAGTAPANYAAQASSLLGTIQGALRDLVLDVTSGVLPVNGGQFDASALIFGFPTNSVASFDYDAGFLGARGIALSGLSTNKIVDGATLSGAPGAQTITIQIDTEFRFRALSDNDSSVRLIGKLVATEAQSGPTISSIGINNGMVVLRVEGGGADPKLESSSDLTRWSAQTPTKTVEGDTVTLSLPTEGTQQFYRVAN